MKAGFRGLRGIIAVLATLQLDSSALSFLQVGAIDLDAGTIVIRAYTEAAGTIALADIAADPNNRISIEIVAKWLPGADGSGVT